MVSAKLETNNAKIQDECLIRVQIPSTDVSRVLEAIINVVPLRYGNYEKVSFQYRNGIQRYQPVAGSRMGRGELVCVVSDEISFTVPKNDESIIAVVDAILESHPYEEPVIIIQDAMCTRFKSDSVKNVAADSIY